MPTTVLQQDGTEIVFAGSGFSPADAGTQWSSDTTADVTLSLSAVADGAGRQSAKGDLGANYAAQYELFAAVDFTGEAPTAGNTVDYYWAPSPISTAGSGNVAGNSGSDAAAPGGALGSITLSEFIDQCLYIGSLVCHDGAVVQNGYIGRLRPPARYGQLIVVNNSGDVFEADNVEAHAVLIPIEDEIQN